ncbi:MAG: hypothetical protein K2W95_35670 [Candidatus Obscuribacterales bacterium]|nr:hypothetical protein [Candidatus Obscuribacterales bacterium]
MANQTVEKKQVIDAIGELGRRVTPADVALKTGLPVLVVTQTMNAVAAETGGHLQVSSAGDVVYAFSPGFSNTYLTRGVMRFFEVATAKLGHVLFYLLKISFGIMLILSLLMVIVTVFIIFFSQKNGDDRDGGDPRFDFLDYMILREIFAFTVYSQQPVVYDYNLPTVRKRKKSNFLLNCFSFLFGDGNPNEGLDEKTWQLVANVIKKHDNVVTAEQLAPYTGADPKNEDGVLPVLVRFNGKPEVTESGNIVYVFPDLSVTAGAASTATSTPPPYLREFKWKFTELDPGALLPVYVVAGLNFFGAWFVWWLFWGSPHGQIGMVFNVLAVYGTLFLLVPSVRWVLMQGRNKQVDERNKQRAGFAEQLLSPPAPLQKKLAETRAYRLRDKTIGAKDIVYTTEKDALDQEDGLDVQFKKMEVGDTFDASPGPGS